MDILKWLGDFLPWRARTRYITLVPRTGGASPALLEAPRAEGLPRHVAIIMDGNGRWAKARALPRAMGHRAGAESLREVITAAGELYIECLTVYAFSTENWLRPADEVGALMALLSEFLAKELDELDRKGVRILFIGELSRLPRPQLTVVNEAMERTAANQGLKLNIALNYGARDELTRAACQLAQRVERGELSALDITADMLEGALYTAGQPDVDLLIRTSGELRLSNFLLFQCAYAEFIFEKTLWPDYTRAVFYKNLMEYQSRERRYGARSAQDGGDNP